MNNKQIRKEDLDFLITASTIDVSKFIGLSIDEINELPENEKKCIENFSFTKETHENGKVKETLKIKLVSRLQAIKQLNDVLGFYDEKK